MAADAEHLFIQVKRGEDSKDEKLIAIATTLPYWWRVHQQEEVVKQDESLKHS